ncbi:MAG: hypothetical protein EXQ89_05425 [Rhodospirillaceae bacterium]|nr:hypothetical protein [Rhodospirillaceae bacterium]
MHTLIVLQNDKKVKQRLPREGRLEFGIAGSPITYKLQVHTAGTPAAITALGGLSGALGAAYLDSANRMRRTIVAFADWISQPPHTVDVVEFQVIFIFHQMTGGTAKDITRALGTLDGDADWRNLPDRNHVGIRVRRCWLLSCESGTDQAAADDPNLAGNPALMRSLRRWIDQAQSMRLAAAAFTTEQKPPPANPKQYWLPFIYTFSSGDPVTGSTVLFPERVSFRRLPYTITPNGDFEKIPKPAGGTQTDEEYENGTSTAGKIYKYEGATKVDERIVPANAEANVLTGGF